MLLIDTILFQTLMNFRKGQIKCKESTFKFLSVKESCRIIVWSLKTVNSPPFLAPAWIQSRFPPARTRVMPGHVLDCAAWHVSPGLATSEAQHLTNFQTGAGKLLPPAEIYSVVLSYRFCHSVYSWGIQDVYLCTARWIVFLGETKESCELWIPNSIHLEKIILMAN